MKKKIISDCRGEKDVPAGGCGDKIEEKARLFHFVSSNIS
jgi:hypothetical protein